tara:strand:- start:4361 stop:4696 length:336 start_codon:yes stop_codon:yes gene_type:complete
MANDDYEYNFKREDSRVDYLPAHDNGLTSGGGLSIDQLTRMEYTGGSITETAFRIYQLSLNGGYDYNETNVWGNEPDHNQRLLNQEINGKNSQFEGNVDDAIPEHTRNKFR